MAEAKETEYEIRVVVAGHDPKYARAIKWTLACHWPFKDESTGERWLPINRLDVMAGTRTICDSVNAGEEKSIRGLGRAVYRTDQNTDPDPVCIIYLLMDLVKEIDPNTRIVEYDLIKL